MDEILEVAESLEGRSEMLFEPSASGAGTVRFDASVRTR